MKKEVKYPKLAAEMAKNGESQIVLAKVLGTTVVTVCRKMSGKSLWTIEDIDAICEHYKKDYHELFK